MSEDPSKVNYHKCSRRGCHNMIPNNIKYMGCSSCREYEKQIDHSRRLNKNVINEAIKMAGQSSSHIGNIIPSLIKLTSDGFYTYDEPSEGKHCTRCGNFYPKSEFLGARGQYVNTCYKFCRSANSRADSKRDRSDRYTKGTNVQCFSESSHEKNVVETEGRVGDRDDETSEVKEIVADKQIQRCLPNPNDGVEISETSEIKNIMSDKETQTCSIDMISHMTKSDQQTNTKILQKESSSRNEYMRNYRMSKGITKEHRIPQTDSEKREKEKLRKRKQRAAKKNDEVQNS